MSNSVVGVVPPSIDRSSQNIFDIREIGGITSGAVNANLGFAFRSSIRVKAFDILDKSLQDDSLSDIEIADVRLSQEERVNGETKRFSDVKDLIKDLHAD